MLPISSLLALFAVMSGLFYLYVLRKHKKLLNVDDSSNKGIITNPVFKRVLGRTVFISGASAILVKSLSISAFALLVSGAVGFSVAALTWKLYPQFVSRSERYRTSNAKYLLYRSFTSVMLGYLLSSFSMNYVFRGLGTNEATVKESSSKVDQQIQDKTTKSLNSTNVSTPPALRNPDVNALVKKGSTIETPQIQNESTSSKSGSKEALMTTQPDEGNAKSEANSEAGRIDNNSAITSQPNNNQLPRP
jgi:hypothetical protein